jgi:hypothetical protein
MVDILKQSLNFTKMIAGSETKSIESIESLKGYTRNTRNTLIGSLPFLYSFVINIVTFTL